jgi:CheY-like chemotaxis protein
LALLAGRKLLLADDSITIQKVVALTFADEGVEVVTVSDGQQAIEKLKEGTPDIVLADALMPLVNGYEVCEYIKQDAKLKHIPVMLLVGSFEPFDEAEARRVGADEILTKPFQSIRRLIDKVGGLVSGKTASDEVPTAELPHVEQEPVEPEKLTTEELEITTADTQRLPLAEKLPEVVAFRAAAAEQALQAEANKLRDNQEMDNRNRASGNEGSLEASDVLLDLGDIGESYETEADDFVLDIDLDEVEPAGALEAGVSSKLHFFVEPQLSEPSVVGWDLKRGEPEIATVEFDTSDLNEAQLTTTQEWQRAETAPLADIRPEAGRVEAEAVIHERIAGEPLVPERVATPIGQIGVEQLSPEAIDAIAKRAVEHLSERVVQEIAWEVVPQLAELLIKRRLEEKESQSN